MAGSRLERFGTVFTRFQMVWMARYLLELSLVDGQCVAFLPVHLAGAALCLARQVLQEPPTPEGEAAWCLVSSLHIGSESVLLRIMSILASAAATAQTRDTCATYLKAVLREIGLTDKLTPARAAKKVGEPYKNLQGASETTIRVWD
ncbi:hypothetical protein D4764_0013890 [Takifugu flavidus]|uniref:Cyclin C-terminal domain-containing protein n=1 Tax=Takifugu flavidus TaxID=433684 RepID=A0A5C6MDV0_9TELE|nr:hypothetical protein D4764_0013890 [Takifugu flavidus]